MSVESIGWIATAIFVSSYFFKEGKLKLVQASGALTWLFYGIVLGSKPIIVCNLLVFSAAIGSWIRARTSSTTNKNPS